MPLRFLLDNSVSTLRFTLSQLMELLDRPGPGRVGRTLLTDAN